MKKTFSLFTLLCFVFLLTSCQKSSQKNASETKNQTAQIQVTDSQKHQVTFTKVPEKVVVFDAGALDTMDKLGLKEKVVGVAAKNLPDYLSDFKKVTSVGGIKEPDLEKINALKPDLIIISGRQSDFYNQLKAIAPTLYVGIDYTKPFESMEENIQLLGKIFQKEAAVKQELANLKKETQTLKQQVEKENKKSLIVLMNEGSLSAYGKNSRFGLIHDVFGFLPVDDKIQASTHGNSISYEYILAKNPEIIFVIDRTKAIGGDTSKNDLAHNPLVKKTTAGKNQQVITLNPDLWYLSGGGLESFHLMMEDVKKATTGKL